MAGLGFPSVLAVVGRARLDWAVAPVAPAWTFLGGTLCLAQWDFGERFGVEAPGFGIFCASVDDAGWWLGAILAAGLFTLAGSRLPRTAGFTPAEIAAFAAAAESGGWRRVPRRSGFTMIWRS